MFFFDFLILLVFFCCMGCERTTEKIIRDLNCKSAIETENGKTMDEELSEEELLHFNKMFFTQFTLKASDDNWKISAITREGDEEWIEDAKTSSAKKTGTTVVSELKRLLNEELAKAKALPHTKMLYGTPIDPKETQVLNTSVEDTKASSMRNALIVCDCSNCRKFIRKYLCEFA